MSRKPKCLFTLTFLLLPFFVFAQVENSLSEQIKANLYKQYLSQYSNKNEVVELLKAQQEDGSWQEVDYASKARSGWPARQHLENLKILATAYQTPTDRLFKSEILLESIQKALDFWNKTEPLSDNWWQQEIGVPMGLSPILILMEKELDSADMQASLKIMDKAQIKMTGQNKVWLSGNVLVRSTLRGDDEQVKKAINSIQEEIVLSTKEGIQPDFSFHQHGPQQQFGNYGLSYASSTLFWLQVTQGTDFEFEQEKIDILKHYLFDGIAWVVWHEKMDISACGRQLFPSTPSHKAESALASIKAMEKIVDERSVIDNGFEGKKFFWRSDMLVSQDPHYYFSVKMSSGRVRGAETVNSENLQGYHMGDGASFLYQNNEEYTDIFPLWDWRKIPGTTTLQLEEKLPVLTSKNSWGGTDFVGGIATGEHAIATMHYKKDGLEAKKSWFVVDGETVCLGTDISSSKPETVATTIQQSWLKDNILARINGKITTLNEGGHTFTEIDFLRHDNVVYVFEENPKIQLSNEEVSGSWDKVAQKLSDKPVRGKVFKLWIDHGANPTSASYAYYIFPRINSQDFEQLLSNKPVEIVYNSGETQAVGNENMLMAVYHQASLAKFGRVQIKAEQPCVMSVTRQGETIFNFVASDPTHKLESLTFTLKGAYLSSNPNLMITNKGRKSTTVTIDLPQGGEAGKAVSFSLSKKP
ncbi:polysaccharide lyase 8 family protein [Flammeovirgaceae bacterium SG7u.111]|nr:polysaccharide lyase 8 family protein [Flammeovirgaceae bacterium SG7u.132]WPO34295.1 polysaccharide lyase 8 family protein [Flammeovirgaceae bacterium SG7u.111]